MSAAIALVRLLSSVWTGLCDVLAADGWTLVMALGNRGHKTANWKQITHTDSHALVVAFTCALARTSGSSPMQDFTHTISHT